MNWDFDFLEQKGISSKFYTICNLLQIDIKNAFGMA
jgi:hypothetical protein